MTYTVVRLLLTFFIWLAALLLFGKFHLHYQLPILHRSTLTHHSQHVGYDCLRHLSHLQRHGRNRPLQRILRRALFRGTQIHLPRLPIPSPPILSLRHRLQPPRKPNPSLPINPNLVLPRPHLQLLLPQRRHHHDHPLASHHRLLLAPHHPHRQRPGHPTGL